MEWGLIQLWNIPFLQFKALYKLAPSNPRNNTKPCAVSFLPVVCLPKYASHSQRKISSVLQNPREREGFIPSQKEKAKPLTPPLSTGPIHFRQLTFHNSCFFFSKLLVSRGSLYAESTVPVLFRWELFGTFANLTPGALHQEFTNKEHTVSNCTKE